MKMHQFAFVQKCPALTSTALPPPPLNVQLTLSRGKVNMSTAPKLFAGKLQTQTTQETSGTFRQVPTSSIRLSFGECANSDLRDIFFFIILGVYNRFRWNPTSKQQLWHMK